MRTRLVLDAVLVLALSACASPDSAPGTTTASVSTTSSVVTADSQTTTTQPATEDATAATRPSPNPDRDLAPDFSLILSDGTEYRLANEVRPVYLVFWAEW